MKKRKSNPPVNDEVVRALHDQGWSDRKIARCLSYSQAAITRRRQNMGLSPNNAPSARGAIDAAQAVAMCQQGIPFKSIARHFGVHQSAATRFLRRRGLASQWIAPPKKHRPRASMRKAVPCVIQATTRDDVFARIYAATRFVKDPVLRDDIMSEMYLAYAEGRLAVDSIEAEARAFSSRAMRDWQSKWSARSLDQDLTGDGFHLIDTIVCPSAARWAESVGA